MTLATSGMGGSLWICATEAGTYVKLGELSDLKLKVDGAEIDTSNVDDAGWGSSIVGKRNWSLSASHNLILTDAGYAIFIAAVLASTTIYVKALSSGTPLATPKGFSGPAGCKGGTLTLAGTNTQQKGDWEIQGRGALTPIA